jgi:hypothetical protein
MRTPFQGNLHHSANPSHSSNPTTTTAVQPTPNESEVDTHTRAKLLPQAQHNIPTTHPRRPWGRINTNVSEISTTSASTLSPSTRILRAETSNATLYSSASSRETTPEPIQDIIDNGPGMMIEPLQPEVPLASIEVQPEIGNDRVLGFSLTSIIEPGDGSRSPSVSSGGPHLTEVRTMESQHDIEERFVSFLFLWSRLMFSSPPARVSSPISSISNHGAENQLPSLPRPRQQGRLSSFLHRFLCCGNLTNLDDLEQLNVQRQQ